MPQLVQLKFAPEEMPRLYDPAKVEGLQPEDFVIAERENGDDVGFVAGIEWVSREQLRLRQAPERRVVRRASEAEKEAFFVRKANERKALILCKEVASQLKLPIKISHARIHAGDGRVIFHFTSDQRIDFRQLVREMSARLKSRVELWQIGVRDEAKKVDGVGVCGLRTCCSAWLPDFRPISIRLAKDQDITLPPSKLSGLCGRLLCCLSYEVDQYRAAGKKLLPKGATVEVNGKKGVIIDRNILLARYTLKMEDGPYQLVEADDMGGVRIPDQMKKMADVVRGGLEEEASQQEAVTRPVPPTEEKPTREDGPSREKSRRDKPRREEGPAESGRGNRRRKGRRDKAADPSGSAKADAPPREGADSPDNEGDSRRKRRRGRRGGAKASGEAQGGQGGSPEAKGQDQGGDDSGRSQRKGSGRRRGRRGGRRGKGKGGGGEG